MRKVDRALPFRYRLTLWYIFIFTLSLLGFEALSYFEFRADLLSQIDAGLLSALNQAIQNIDVENNNLAFQQNEDENAIKPLVSIKNPYSIRIIDANGSILESMTEFPPLPVAPQLAVKRAASPAYTFQTAQSGLIRYRVATAEFAVPGVAGQNFIQVAISLTEMESQLSRYLTRFFIALPFVLIVATLGGLFLAWRALNPIVAMEKLAARVREDHLSDRLNYHGPRDEIGSLAATFDAMLDRLEASFSREKRFSADASHELRTPLTALKGKIEVALSRSRSAPEYEASLVSMKDDIERLIALSADLLLLSKAGSADLSSRFEDLEIEDLVDSCLEQVIEANPEKHIHIERSYERGLRTRGVRDYLIRVFLNILDNAVKFSDNEVFLSITVKRDGGGVTHADAFEQSSVRRSDQLRIEIADRGCGIPEGELSKLFEPFYRVESDRSRERGGAGLGLAICKEIIEAHAGEIHIKSALGIGTTVIIALPLVSPPSRLSRTAVMP